MSLEIAFVFNAGNAFKEVWVTSKGVGFTSTKLLRGAFSDSFLPWVSNGEWSLKVPGMAGRSHN